MERIAIKVEPREVTGKKVKKLRATGVIPANLFGKDFTSTSISVDAKEFQKAFKGSSGSSLVDVKLGEKVYPSLVHNLQRDPRKDFIIHIDFQKVNLKEKITTYVPVILEGESPAEKSGTALLLQTLNEIEIECLPTDIPQNIAVDAEKLIEVGQSVHVKDLKIDKEKIEVKNDPEEVVVTVQNAEMKEEEPEVEVSPEEVEATAEKGEEESSEEGSSEEASTEAKE